MTNRTGQSVWRSFYDDLCQLIRQLAYLAHSDFDQQRWQRVQSALKQIECNWYERERTTHFQGHTRHPMAPMENPFEPLDECRVSSLEPAVGQFGQIGQTAHEQQQQVSMLPGWQTSQSNPLDRRSSPGGWSPWVSSVQSLNNMPLMGDQMGPADSSSSSWLVHHKQHRHKMHHQQQQQQQQAEGQTPTRPPASSLFGTDSPRSLDHYRGFGANYPRSAGNPRASPDHWPSAEVELEFADFLDLEAEARFEGFNEELNSARLALDEPLDEPLKTPTTGGDYQRLCALPDSCASAAVALQRQRGGSRDLIGRAPPDFRAAGVQTPLMLREPLEGRRQQQVQLQAQQHAQLAQQAELQQGCLCADCYDSEAAGSLSSLSFGAHLHQHQHQQHQLQHQHQHAQQQHQQLQLQGGAGGPRPQVVCVETSAPPLEPPSVPARRSARQQDRGQWAAEGRPSAGRQLDLQPQYRQQRQCLAATEPTQPAELGGRASRNRKSRRPARAPLAQLSEQEAAAGGQEAPSGLAAATSGRPAAKGKGEAKVEGASSGASAAAAAAAAAPAVDAQSNASSTLDQADKWSDSEADAIVRGARETAQMALSMYQFTRGEGDLNTTQDLFTQAELFAEEANELYKEVRCFSYKVSVNITHTHNAGQSSFFLSAHLQLAKWTVCGPKGCRKLAWMCIEGQQAHFYTRTFTYKLKHPQHSSKQPSALYLSLFISAISVPLPCTGTSPSCLCRSNFSNNCP